MRGMNPFAVDAPDLTDVREDLDRLLSAFGTENPVLAGLDVDGTLVNHDGDMSPELHDVLQRTAATRHVVIATGRSIGATLPIARLAGIDRGYAVCSNGAITVELDPALPQGHRIMDTRSFAPREALTALREVAPDAHYAVETAEGGFFSTRAFQDASFGTRALETPFEDLLDLQAVRVVVHVPDLSPAEFSDVVAQAGVHGVEYAIGWTAWLDMAAPGVSKASALEAVRARLGVERERTVAVGDGFNDTEMLEWAGAGIAMGQAPDGVKAIADGVTGPVGLDGAALVLERILPIAHASAT